MALPGNSLRDNWYMGNLPVTVKTWGDLVERMDGFSPAIELVNENGGSITLRMSDEAGVVIVA